ncbi:hypothetical protein JOF56_007911 [Kibdelosporangium banguiense]|uniref:Uncharacterized protein n=1 Tax=Kibdelosporangium banguiense TaxID=1365924 RepID=A0ABS4TSZ9_9PSEU|nr:hypothetical protein [Kibdelosporangium banguiense]MBP2327526.1 hypothetical protein [Kibdelosporangium banguiense]
MSDGAVHKLVVAISLVSGRLTVGLDTAGLDRAEFYLDGHRVDCLALHGEPMTTTVTGVHPGQDFRVVAFAGGRPAAAHRLTT